MHTRSDVLVALACIGCAAALVFESLPRPPSPCLPASVSSLVFHSPFRLCLRDRDVHCMGFFFVRQSNSLSRSGTECDQQHRIGDPYDAKVRLSSCLSSSTLDFETTFVARTARLGPFTRIDSACSYSSRCDCRFCRSDLNDRHPDDVTILYSLMVTFGQIARHEYGALMLLRCFATTGVLTQARHSPFVFRLSILFLTIMDRCLAVCLFRASVTNAVFVQHLVPTR